MYAGFFFVIGLPVLIAWGYDSDMGNIGEFLFSFFIVLPWALFITTAAYPVIEPVHRHSVIEDWSSSEEKQMSGGTDERRFTFGHEE